MLSMLFYNSVVYTFSFYVFVRYVNLFVSVLLVAFDLGLFILV